MSACCLWGLMIMGPGFLSVLIFRMCGESFSWELTDIALSPPPLSPSSPPAPLHFFSSRTCLCCWIWSGAPARASTTSSPARRTGSPDCRALVNEQKHTRFLYFTSELVFFFTFKNIMDFAGDVTHFCGPIRFFIMRQLCGVFIPTRSWWSKLVNYIFNETPSMV